MWMRNSYNRRKKDFKRRILKRVDIRQSLKEEEQKWISFILDEELGKKYYNLTKNVFGYWFEDEQKLLNTKQRISKSLKEGQHPNILKTDPIVKQKYIDGNKKQFSDSINREVVRQQMIAQWQDPEFRARMVRKHSGKQQSQETIEKRKATMLRKRNASF